MPIETVTSQNDMIMYCGLALEYITGNKIPAAIHRVVRQPGGVRYSFPFEAKPSDLSILTPPNVTEKDQTVSAKSFYVQADWDRVTRKVQRQDAYYASFRSHEEGRLQQEGCDGSGVMHGGDERRYVFVYLY